MATKYSTAVIPALKALSDTVIVQETETPNLSGGGVFIPETARRTPWVQSVVVSAGPGKTENGLLVPMTVKQGDRVLTFGSGTDFVFGGVTYHILHQNDIRAVIE